MKLRIIKWRRGWAQYVACYQNTTYSWPILLFYQLRLRRRRRWYIHPLFVKKKSFSVSKTSFKSIAIELYGKNKYTYIWTWKFHLAIMKIRANNVSEKRTTHADAIVSIAYWHRRTKRLSLAYLEILDILF